MQMLVRLKAVRTVFILKTHMLQHTNFSETYLFRNAEKAKSFFFFLLKRQPLFCRESEVCGTLSS
jgi:hypothetical protein